MNIEHIIGLIIGIPCFIAVILLIGSRENWFGSKERAKKIDGFVHKAMRPLVFLFGLLFHSPMGAVNLEKEIERATYTCRYCRYESFHNSEICPKCSKDDYGVKKEDCIYCRRFINVDYKYCPHCGNKKLK